MKWCVSPIHVDNCTHAHNVFCMLPCHLIGQHFFQNRSSLGTECQAVSKAGWLQLKKAQLSNVTQCTVPAALCYVQLPLHNLSEPAALHPESGRTSKCIMHYVAVQIQCGSFWNAFHRACQNCQACLQNNRSVLDLYDRTVHRDICILASL